MEAGFPILLADGNGGRLTPSVVHFPAEGAPLIGRTAARMRAIDPENTIYSVKPLIGRPFDSDEVKTAASRPGGIGLFASSIARPTRCSDDG